MSLDINVRNFIGYLVALIVFIYPSSSILLANYGYLLLFGIFIILVSYIFKRDKYSLKQSEKIFLITFIMFFIIAAINVYFSGGKLRELDTYSRFILVLPFFFFIRSSNVSYKWFLYGFSLAALIFGANLFSQRIFNYEFFSFTKHTGMISLYGSIFGVTSLFLADRSRAIKINTFLITSGIFGIITSFYAGGRGTWIAAILSMVALYFMNPMKWKGIEKIATILLFLSLFILSLFIPNTGVKLKVNQAFDGVIEYYSQNQEKDLTKGLSVITRLEMWKSALIISKESNFLGIGEGNFKRYNRKLIDDGLVSSSIKQYNHPHGQFLSTLVQQGLIGLVVLLWLLYIPIFIIRYDIKNLNENINIKSLHVALIVISVQYLGYSITNGIFAHQNTTLFFALSIALLTGFLFQEKRRVKQ